VIAVRDEILEKYPEAIKNILNTINETTKSFKDISNIDKMLADKYNQETVDIQEWLILTEWSKPVTKKC
jgi:ABC-type nitrate/sulfonate/bicarbonate transport system substrate-binding protein